MNSFELAKKGSMRVGDAVRCKSVSASAHGVFGEVGQIVGGGDIFEVAVCGLRLWFYADDLEVVNNEVEPGADSGAVGGVGSASGGDVGAGADYGAGNVSGTCPECGKPYSTDS